MCLPCECSWSSPLLKTWAELLSKKWCRPMLLVAPARLTMMTLARALTAFSGKLDDSSIEEMDTGSETLVRSLLNLMEMTANVRLLQLQRVVQSHPGRPLGLVTFGEGAKVSLQSPVRVATVLH